jgi:hypothetical protein
MATISRTDTPLELRPIDDFAGVPEWPRGERLEAIREAAGRFRERFRAQGEIRAVRTIDLAAAAYPARFAFHGSAKAVNPYVSIVNRLVVVQYEDFSGQLRTLAWEPTVPEGSATAPFYAQLIRRYGEYLSHRVFAKYFHTVESALGECGLRPEDVDVTSFDHLHVQDVRHLIGTDRPVAGEPAPRAARFPNALLLAQRAELDTLRSPHPMQWAWYVPDGLEGAPDDRQVVLDGDVELGHGVALLRTPGHTDGNQTLVLNTPDGIWVTSENGVAADNWQPELSRIPGVRREAAFYRREVCMNANTLEDSIDQYDSMVKEKTIADPSRRDPRWRQVLPSSELVPWRRQWPVVPTFFHGPDALRHGSVERPA